MLNGNGHHNKALSPNGEAALGKIAPSLENTRADVVKAIAAINTNLSQFMDTPERSRAVLDFLYEVAKDPNSRQRVRAMEVYTKAKSAAIDQAIKMAEVIDKIHRLDSGDATERHEHAVYEVRMPEARNRISE